MTHVPNLYVRTKSASSPWSIAAIKRAVANGAERDRLILDLAEAAREWANADASYWAKTTSLRRASARDRIDYAEAKMRRIAAKIEAAQ